MLDRVLRVLEYPKILEQLSNYAGSTLGKEKVNQLRPQFSYDEVLKAQRATDEGFTVLRLKGDMPLGGIRDIRPSLKRVSIGGMLSPVELLDIGSTLYAGRRIKTFLEGLCSEAQLPILGTLMEQLSPLKSLEQEIHACIDEHGDVLDGASPGLREVRQQIRSAESRIRQKLEQMIRSSSIQKMLQDVLVTIRNERYCLPVKAEHRSQFGGMVHDQSASGATLFIEPEAVVTINNQLREYKLKEEQEIEKILRRLSAQVAEVLDPLATNVEVLAEIDFILAKAYYGVHLSGVIPKLNQAGYFRLKKARHPLIPREEIVPVSFELGDAYTSLIITGPNTGGKTVTLKTLGLLTLMSCSGLAVPADEGTEIAVVSAVFADIGDEQSIEQSLSTFSSHMTNIVRILEQLDERSLVLFDELGAGTDPTEGAALAISILNYVGQRGARIAATTHYSELKAYASSKAGVINASVEFDIETLRPTYRLLVGVPGRSNAFAIAQRLGLKTEVIAEAKEQIGEEEARVESMIASLEEHQKTAEQERVEAERLRREVEQLRQQLHAKEELLEREKERRIEAAEREALAYFAQSQAEAEQIIQELRALAAENKPIKDHLLIEARKKLEEAQASVSSYKKRKPTSPQHSKNVQFRAGDEVFVQTFGQKGHIVDKVSDQEYTVQIGIMKMKVESTQLQKIQSDVQKVTPKAIVKTADQPIKLELDVRGKTVDEAIMDMDKYIDDALLTGYHQVSIIHGKGTGQLRKGVQEFLKKHKQVKALRMGNIGEGGSGVTVIKLS